MSESQPVKEQLSAPNATCICGLNLTKDSPAHEVVDALTEGIRFFGFEPETAPTPVVTKAVLIVLRNALMKNWEATRERRAKSHNRFIHYISIEFLPGKLSETYMDGADLNVPMRAALSGFGLDPELVFEHEPDPATGNGGLGRLASCISRGLATAGYPAFDYGILYTEGLFKQIFDEFGGQKGLKDEWTDHGIYSTLPRDYRQYKVELFDGAATVTGMAFDMAEPGFGNDIVNTSRFWKIIDIQSKEANQHQKDLAKEIDTKLYPPDNNNFGKDLRFIQGYVLASLTMQDIIARHLRTHETLDNFADHNVIQLNDTHPTFAILETMRIFVDQYGMERDKARDIAHKTFFYTNHTIMPEALECWEQGRFEYINPRLYHIAEELNLDLMNEIDRELGRLPGDERNGIKRESSFITEHDGKKTVRMANLAAFLAAGVNGVSKQHAGLVKDVLLPTLSIIRGPKAVIPITNGIAYDRFLLHANPELAQLITDYTNTETKAWITNPALMAERLKGAEKDTAFRERFHAIKYNNKVRLSNYIRSLPNGPLVSPEALFDIQAKRIHAYKRQSLNALHVVDLLLDYLDISRNPKKPRIPVVKIFAGKAALGYQEAGNVINLINELALVINNDHRLHDMLKVYFIPDYNVTKAQKIVAAADLSEQISMAGKEASGTGNMKFALNGAITVGTLDGANVEIRDEVGPDNIYIFGKTVEEQRVLNNAGYNPKDYLTPQIEEIFDWFRFQKDGWLYGLLADKVLGPFDEYRNLGDYESYSDTQRRIHHDFTNQEGWLTKSILNTTRSSHFNILRTVHQYANELWKVEPELPLPSQERAPTPRTPLPLAQQAQLFAHKLA